jgi:glutaredoxin
MRVSIVYFDGCPHWERAHARLAHAIDYAGVGHVEVDLVSVATREEAISQGMRGSPTILIDGADPFATPGMPRGLACRIFATEHGPDGSPSVGQLIEALRDAHDGLLEARGATDDASFSASDPREAGGSGL